MTATDVAPDRAPPVTTVIGKPELVLKSSEFRKGRRGRLARARRPGHPRRAARRALALARRAAAAADPLPRRALFVVGGAHHRARPQSAALSGKPRAARVPGGVRTAGAPAGGARRLLRPRAAGCGARRALAYPDRGAGAAGWRALAGFMLTAQDEGLVLLAGAVLARRRARTVEHARRSPEQGDLPPGRARPSRSASSPTCCSATTRWSGS